MTGHREKLRAAVIGVGYLGAFHAQKYRQLEDVDLVAVVDTDLDRAKHIAAREHTQALADYRPLIETLDLVSIAVPTPMHFAIARDALSAGVPTLLEKPMARTVDEARQLTELAERRGTPFQVGHLERFNPAVRGAAEELRDPYFVEAHRLAPYNPRGTDVDVVLDLMIHDIDILLSFVRSPLASVQAVGVAALTPSIDIANARLQFVNGCVANLTASRISNKQMRKIRVFEHNTYVSIDCAHSTLSVYRRKPDQDGADAIDSAERRFERSDALLDQIRAFVNSVRTGAPPLVSGREALYALEVASQISAVVAATPHQPMPAAPVPGARAEPL